MGCKISELLEWDDGEAIAELSDVLCQLDKLLTTSEKEDWIKSFIEDLTDKAAKVNLLDNSIYIKNYREDWEDEVIAMARAAAAMRKAHDTEDGWGEHPDWPMSEWAREADSLDTRLGYWEWVLHKMAGE